jgi:membrane protease YdiL (CAAX protease family)
LLVVLPLDRAVRAMYDLPRDVKLPALTIAETLVVDAMLLGCTVGLAALVARPRARHFGLRPTRPWPAIGFSLLGLATYLGFAALYQRLSPEEVRQSTLETLGADRGTVALVAVGLLVVVAAPVTEEVFFRGFLYRSLRSRLSIPTATVLAGGAFGLVHASTGVAATLPLAVLGVVFCLIVERTGSLYPVIALHAGVNAMAYSFSPDAPDGSPAVALPLLGAVLLACVVLPRLSRAGRPAAVGAAPAPG